MPWMRVLALGIKEVNDTNCMGVAGCVGVDWICSREVLSLQASPLPCVTVHDSDHAPLKL